MPGTCPILAMPCPGYATQWPDMSLSAAKLNKTVQTNQPKSNQLKANYSNAIKTKLVSIQQEQLGLQNVFEVEALIYDLC